MPYISTTNISVYVVDCKEVYSSVLHRFSPATSKFLAREVLCKSGAQRRITMPEDYILDLHDDFDDPSPPPAEKRRKFDQPTRGPALVRPPSDQRVDAARIAPVDAADVLMEGVPVHVREALGEHGLKVLRNYLDESNMDYRFFSSYYGNMAANDYDKAQSSLEPGLRAWTGPVLSAIAPGSDTPNIKK